jgi:hypothetical protein
MIFVALLVIIKSILTNFFYDYEKAGKLTEYAVVAVCIVGYFVYNARKADDVHIHHYTIAWIILSFTGYQNIFATVVSGIFNGIMIEGGSFYGWDPIFVHYKPKPHPHHDVVPTKSPFQKSESLAEIRKLSQKSMIKIENQEMQRLLVDYEKREKIIHNDQ